MGRAARRAWAGTLATFLALIVVLLGAPLAAADDTAATYVVEGQLGADGMLKMTETIAFPGAAPDTLTQRLAGYVDGKDTARYLYTITDVKAAARGIDLAAGVTVDSGYTVITVPTKGATGPIQITYTVKGTTITAADSSTLFQWRVLQGLSVGVDEVSGTIVAPAPADDYACQSGPPSATTTCRMYSGGTHDSPNLTFTDGPRGPGEVVVNQLTFKDPVVAVTQDVTHRWSLDRAFTAKPAELLAALAALMLGGLALWALHRRVGRDIVGRRTAAPVASFIPSGEGEVRFDVGQDGVRPGIVGTVVDQYVDPIDITATLLDLAVRGHLLITELPRHPSQALIDWSFTRREGDDELRAYESRLLDAVAPAGAEQPATVSRLAHHLGAAIGDVRSDLYDEVVARGWFGRRPDAQRSTWTRLGWTVLAAAVALLALLVAFTTFGLLGLALAALGLGAIFVAQEMPARTAQGTELLASLRVLGTQLDNQPLDQIPADRAYAEVSRVLPYAIVLGGWERWLGALAAADDDDVADPADLAWYHAPEHWHLRDLPASLDAFVTTVQGRLFSR